MKTEKDELEIMLNGLNVMENAQKVALKVQRPVYQIEELNAATTYEYEPDSFSQKVSKAAGNCRPVSCLYRSIPILQWLPKYNVEKNLLGDTLSGITVAIMHIPQGMAYGLLGNVPPVVGIYMAFFPIFIYTIFGTSRHVSMGTFAVVCLMTGKVVSEYSHEIDALNATAPSPSHHYSHIQVATTVTIGVSIVQMVMYVFQLGVITALLSETLVNAFTCASAFHVVASQLKDLFGLSVVKPKGLFKIIKTVRNCIEALPNANRAAYVMSAIFVFAMVLNNEFLKPRLAKITRIPFPIELVAVVGGTCISYFFNMHETLNLSVVGHVPTGFPEPALPAFELLPKIVVEVITITMVSYTITMSMGLMLQQKHFYEVDPNQELLALSFSNCFGSFFSCMPITASLSRSMIQEAVGGVTQIASVVSCLLLMIVLLWLGPLFETLPKCVLASIIVVALKGMLLQCRALKKYWNLSKYDAVVWIVTFFATVFLSIDIGLVCGIFTSMAAIIIQGYTPYSCLLGVVPNTDLYLDIKRYRAVMEVPDIKIFHYTGGLNFVSRRTFKQHLFKRIGFDPQSVLQKREEVKERIGMEAELEDLLVRCILLDFSAISYLDPSGVELLRTIIDQYQQLYIAVYITGCSGPIYETFVRCDNYEKKDGKFVIFPTIHDGVLYAQATILKVKFT